MNIKTFSNGLLDSNTYVVWDKKECMIVDMGVNPNEVIAFLNNLDVRVKYLVLTHGHIDHSHYVGDYINLYQTDAICHEDEHKVLIDEEANVSKLVGYPCLYDYEYKFVRNDDTITVGDYEFKVLHMPGHTPGCICLLCEKEKIMFTGDVLFAQGIGRTDFKYGNQVQMIDSLNKIRKLDRGITIYPGHGESATLKSIYE
ncbi:MAG: MBL fold metallo-hydrolase [Clostridia bacterium]|nr:MBL fold metallo-hydrolase [Clostridia bacterium]